MNWTASQSLSDGLSLYYDNCQKWHKAVCGPAAKSMGSGVTKIWFRSYLCHSPIVWAGESYLISPSLNFLAYKIMRKTEIFIMTMLWNNLQWRCVEYLAQCLAYSKCSVNVYYLFCYIIIIMVCTVIISISSIVCDLGYLFLPIHPPTPTLWDSSQQKLREHEGQWVGCSDRKKRVGQEVTSVESCGKQKYALCCQPFAPPVKLQ